MGHILFFDKGLDPINISTTDNIETALCDFHDLCDEAEHDGDSFFITEQDNHKELCSGHSLLYAYCSPDKLKSYEPYKNVDLKILEQFTTFRKVIQPQVVSSLDDFQSLTAPNARGGMRVTDYPTEPPLPYICDRISHHSWKAEYFRSNPSAIDWAKAIEDILPNPKSIKECFKRELKKHGYRTYLPEKLHKLGNLFYSKVITHKPDGEKEAYFKEIGQEICLNNYYRYEKRLSANEQRRCKSLRMIFSIIREKKILYLSIDFESGMFELADSNGCHQGEFRWDGKANGNKDTSGRHDIQLS